MSTEVENGMIIGVAEIERLIEEKAEARAQKWWKSAQDQLNYEAWADVLNQVYVEGGAEAEQLTKAMMEALHTGEVRLLQDCLAQAFLTHMKIK